MIELDKEFFRAGINFLENGHVDEKFVPEAYKAEKLLCMQSGEFSSYFRAICNLMVLQQCNFSVLRLKMANAIRTLGRKDRRAVFVSPAVHGQLSSLVDIIVEQEASFLEDRLVILGNYYIRRIDGGSEIDPYMMASYELEYLEKMRDVYKAIVEKYEQETDSVNAADYLKKEISAGRMQEEHAVNGSRTSDYAFLSALGFLYKNFQEGIRFERELIEMRLGFFSAVHHLVPDQGEGYSQGLMNSIENLKKATKEVVGGSMIRMKNYKDNANRCDDLSMEFSN